MEQWIVNELKGIQLGNKRLNVRCGNILNELSVNPEKTINGAFKS